ncbi:MAG: DoxX family membrane protein [Gemmatimonadota bacterium]
MLGTGRIVFGIAMLGFGFVGLLFVDFLNSLQPVPAWIPGYSALAVLNGLVLGAAGAAVLVDRKARPGALAVALLFLAGIVLLHVPSAFIDPELLRSPWWIRTFESVALIGGAVVLAGLREKPIRDRWIRGGRIAFGLAIPVFGVLHLVYPRFTADLVPPWYPWPMFWMYLTAAAQIVGGLAIALNVWARLAAILAGAMYGMFALTLHVPRVWCHLYGPCEFLNSPGGHAVVRREITSLFVAVGMCGAAWLVAGGIERLGDAEDPGRMHA